MTSTPSEPKRPSWPWLIAGALAVGVIAGVLAGFANYFLKTTSVLATSAVNLVIVFVVATVVVAVVRRKR